MKNKKVKSVAKDARKALKKQLNDKFTAQLKAIVSEFEPDLKSLTKAIEKASKNLAKTISAKISDKKDAPARFFVLPAYSVTATFTIPVSSASPSSIDRPIER